MVHIMHKRRKKTRHRINLQRLIIGPAVTRYARIRKNAQGYVTIQNIHALTNDNTAVIMSIEKVLPADGQPLKFNDVIAVLVQGCGDHFFFAVRNRPIIPTMRIPS